MKDLSKNNQFLIGIGSNINPETNIKLALNMLDEQVTILKRASIWQTPAVGSQGPDYLNTAVLIESNLSFDKLKELVLTKIEIQLGRIRSTDKNADRTIDLDVLIHGATCLDEDLWSRAHIAVPAAEIIPDYQNHQTGDVLSNVAEILLGNSATFILRSDLTI